MEKGEKQNVYKVYDRIANWFLENRDTILMEKKYLDKVISYLPDNASVLDLGCGTGKPFLDYLVSKNLNVVGVDASYKMLELAKTNFPLIEFILQDMRLLDLNRKFDAIIAWHSFFHLPAADQPAMFGRFVQHLNPNGILLFTSGTQHGEAWGMNGGENLFHGSLSTKEYQDLFEQHHFEILEHVVEDPQCGNATVWLAQYLGD